MFGPSSQASARPHADRAVEPASRPPAPGLVPQPPASLTLRPEGGHVPALDGVRGLAIVLVILHHGIQVWGPARSPLEKVWGFLSGHAWVGVDLFFVLSGFLITGILLDTKGKTRYFGSFYPRRMLRTFPLYYATILVCLVILPIIPAAGLEGLRQLSSRQGWFWLHVSNFYTVLHNIAVADGPKIGWMATFWSLAVEEHFYLVWPLVVFLCTPKGVARACVALAAAGLALRMILLARGVEFQAIYHLTFTRLDGLLLGSFVAAWSRREGGLVGAERPARVVLLGTAAVVGGLMLLGMVLPRAYEWAAGTVVFTAIAVAFAALLVLVLQSPKASLLRRFFSGRFLQACGKYSYAMYILNIPLFRLLDSVLDPGHSEILGSRVPAMVAYTALGTLLSLAGALVTWHLLEKHCLKLKKYFVATDRVRPALSPAPAKAA